MVKERVITVEYLEPSMSLELLGKFPDNSASGFDYSQSQSNIWSPLLPRIRHAPASLLRSQLRKKLSSRSPATIRKVKTKFSNKKKQSCVGNNWDFTPIPSPKLAVCWKRALRAATKRFKMPAS